MTKKEDWETLWTAAEKFFAGKISVLVNNAGVSPVVGFELCMKVSRLYWHEMLPSSNQSIQPQFC